MVLGGRSVGAGKAVGSLWPSHTGQELPSHLALHTVQGRLSLAHIYDR